jgi:hypothetical protein
MAHEPAASKGNRVQQRHSWRKLGWIRIQPANRTTQLVEHQPGCRQVPDFGSGLHAAMVCPIATLTRLRLATPSKRIFPGSADRVCAAAPESIGCRGKHRHWLPGLWSLPSAAGCCAWHRGHAGRQNVAQRWHIEKDLTGTAIHESEPRKSPNKECPPRSLWSRPGDPPPSRPACSELFSILPH